MAGGGDDGQRVEAVVFAQQRPGDMADGLAVVQHIECAVSVRLTGLPAFCAVEVFHRRPAALRQHGLQAIFAAVAHNQALAGNGTHQVVELGLDGGEVGENVGVVVFEVVQNGGARSVVHKLAALVEEGGVVFIGFDHEKRRAAGRIGFGRLRQAGGNAEVLRNTADEETGSQAGVFQHPGQHGGGGGFAVRTVHAEHSADVQHVLGQPLRAGHIRQAAIQNGLDYRHAALGHVADYIHIGRKFVQLFGIKTFVHGNAQIGQLRAHRRIHFGIAAAHFKARFLRDGGQPAHECAADADNVDVLHSRKPYLEMERQNYNGLVRRWARAIPVMPQIRLSGSLTVQQAT